jgi:tetratricopeptide (TPR) repeat protein
MFRPTIYYLLAAVLIGIGIAPACSRPPPPPADNASAAMTERPGEAETALDPVGPRLLGAGKNEEAAAYFRQQLERDPRNWSARQGLATALCRLGQSDEALGEFARVIEEGPGRADAYFGRGLCLQGLGRERDEQAVADYRSVIRLRPDDAPAHNQLGLIFQARGDHAAAIAEFNTALLLNPADYLAENNLSASLIALGRFEEAIAVLQQAIRLKPEPRGVSLYANLGVAFLRAGRYGQAEAAFLMETAINPANLDAHLNLGNLYALSRRPGEAVYEYQRVLLANPRHEQALVNLGALYVKTGNFEAAVPPLSLAVSLYPANALAHHYLSLAYDALGDVPRAEAEADAARKLGYQPGASTGPAPGGTAAP